MIALHFSGYFQCRLATDPDPYDEPRGVSGWTWAAAGEPDFDRIIRFQNPVALRVKTRPVSVTVSSVFVDGLEASDHPLVGAKVSLIDRPMFEGRNGIVAESGTEPIGPFHLRVTKSGIVLQRDSGSTFPYNALRPVTMISGESTTIARATNVWDFTAELTQRRAKLETLRARLPATQHAKRAAIDGRLAVMNKFFGGLPIIYYTRQIYRFDLVGSAKVVDPKRSMRKVLEGDSWRVEFWLGGYDGDALTGFVDGWLTIPQIRRAPGQPGRKSLVQPQGSKSRPRPF